MLMSFCCFFCGIREILEIFDGGIVCLDWFDNDISIVYKDVVFRFIVLVFFGLIGELFFVSNNWLVLK